MVIGHDKNLWMPNDLMAKSLIVIRDGERKQSRVALVMNAV